MGSRPSTDATYGGLLPRSVSAPMPPRTEPYRWPSEAADVPRTCWNCGAGLIYSNVPTARYDETDIMCWSCSRWICGLISDLTPRRLTPEQFRALPTNQPKRGRPKNQSPLLGPPAPPKKPGPKSIYPDVAVRQRAYRQRDAVGLVSRTRWAVDYDACVVCGQTEYRHNAHGRCMKCRDRSQEPYRVARRAGR